MNPTNHNSLSIGRLAIAALVALAAVAPALAQRYWIEELPPLSPYPRSFGSTIDTAGVVAGTSDNSNYVGHATRWDPMDPNGVAEDLGTLAGWYDAWPHGASNDGTKIVGEAKIYSGGWRWVPFVWERDPQPHLEQLPPPADRDTSGALAVNDDGIIVGAACRRTGNYDGQAPRWDKLNGQWTLRLLDPLPPWPEAHAYGINQSGVIVGCSLEIPVSVACAWGWDPNDPNYPDDVRQLEGLGDPTGTADINDFNQYVGVWTPPGGEGCSRAFFHDGNQAIDLGTPPGKPYSRAYRLNNSETVVGCGYMYNPPWTLQFDDSTALAFVWRRGVMTVLNDALVGGAGWYLTQALDINDRGQIAGCGVLNGQWRACRLTPAYGDLNCDGAVNFADINPFVLALSNPSAYEATFPDCDIMDGDINEDGTLNFGDINPFVALLTGG